MPPGPRLAVIVDTFPRWSERFIARELCELLRRGIDLTVFALKAGELLDKNDPDWLGLSERTVVLPYCITPRLALGRKSKLAARLDAVRAALDASTFSRLNCLPSLVKLLQQGRFTHVHAHFAGLPSTLGWLAAEELKLAFTLSVHARDVFVEPQLLREKIASAQRVFCCHAVACEHLKTLATEPRKVVLMHHGLPLERFPLTLRPTRRRGPLKLIAAGRFVKKKGYRELLELLPPCTAPAPYIFLLCGEGPEQRAIETVIKARKLQPVIKVSPPLSADELLEAFRDADVLVTPFQEAADGDFDGIPNTILEAFATGLSVAGTQTGGMRELLPHRGAIAAPDIRSLAMGISELITNKGSHLVNILAARQLIESEFDLRNVIKPLVREIQT
ncbi:MAG TPA: glycosyltransferase [Planctomycetota bacterium]|nr:glycosyltransferase [Planctomycetota bacterium]